MCLSKVALNLNTNKGLKALGCVESSAANFNNLQSKSKDSYCKVTAENNLLDNIKKCANKYLLKIFKSTSGNNGSTFKEIKCVSIAQIVPVNDTQKGTYYKYIDSKPIRNFCNIADDIDFSKGLSTIPYDGGVLLRGTADIPLGTSGVGNCAVMFLYNSKNNTLALYHAAPIKQNPIKNMKEDILSVMPDGFDRVVIVPGCNPETATTVQNLFVAAKKINSDSLVEFKHSEHDGLVEFVSYKGNIYAAKLKDNKALFPVQNSYK